MGKHKLEQWAELGTFRNVVQPMTGDVIGKDHALKGKWRPEMFMNNNPVVLELCCGKGEYTVGLSAVFPERNFIGIDIKGARMWRGAKTTNQKNSQNAAFLRTRIEFINSFFAENEVDEIWIIFPDPYPGNKNSNKRLTSPWFLNKYTDILKDKGIVHLKTDNLELFRYTQKLVAENNLEVLFSANDLHSISSEEKLTLQKIYSINEGIRGDDQIDEILSIKTHYEKMFLQEGLNINYIAFRLDKAKVIAYGAQQTGK